MFLHNLCWDGMWKLLQVCLVELSYFCHFQTQSQSITFHVCILFTTFVSCILQCGYISIKGEIWNMCSCAICADVSLSHKGKTQRTDTHTAAHTPAYMLICACENVADAYHPHTWTHLKAQMHSKVYSYRDSPAVKAVQMCVLNCTGCSTTHERLSRRLGDRCSTLVQARFQTCTHTHTQLRTLFICQ